MPAYTEPISSRKFAKIAKTNGSAFGPTGRKREMRSSATTASVELASCCSGWRACRACPSRRGCVTPRGRRVARAGSRAPAAAPRRPSVCLPKMPSRVQAGASEVKILVPVNAKPPSTRSAVVSESHSTRSLPGSLLPNANSSPAAASCSTQSSEWSPRSCEHARDADPDQVHVDAERGRRGVGGEQPLVARGLEQAARGEVAGGAQLVEVLGEERVVAVVAGGARADARRAARGSARSCPQASPTGAPALGESPTT